MMRFLTKPSKQISRALLWASCINFLSPNICYTQQLEGSTVADTSKESVDSDYQPSYDATEELAAYTVNFNNVPIIEVIRFISKITNTNFVFQEQDLQFTVTIVSEEPIAVKNILSALIQVLRIHDLSLLEQDNNIVISKNPAVTQLPTIVSSDSPDSINTTSALVTRIFRIKNANVGSIASIVKPFTSQSALVEVSNETKQLIVTDIITNVDKIATLLASLDTPHTSLDIESYAVRNISPADVISLTHQILSPFTEGNPLILVPQTETNTIFIVSTPHLIERALAVMEDIDAPAKPVVVGQKPGAQQIVHIYKIVNKAPADVVSSLEEIADQLEISNATGNGAIITSLKNVKYIQDTNSLLFISDDASWTQIHEILSGIDTAPLVHPASKSGFFIYKIQYSSPDELEDTLHQLASTIGDKDLIATINNVQWIKENNSLVFSGPQAAIDKIKDILPTIDVAEPNKSVLSKGHFLIYTPKYQKGDELQSELEEMSVNLKNSGLSNASLLSTIDSMKWVPSTNSLIFTGDDESLQHIQGILATIDSPTPAALATQTFIYRPVYASEDQLQEALERFAQTLDTTNVSDQNLYEAIHSLQWVSESQSFVFRTDPNTLVRLKETLASLDNPQGLTGGVTRGFFLYKLKHAPGNVVIENLENLAANLPTADISNKNLAKSIESLKWIKENNSILISGSQITIEQVKGLISEFDIAALASVPTPKSEFFIYKPVNQSAESIQESLTNLSDDLENSGLIDTDLFHALNSVKYVPVTNSLLFTGTPESLAKVKGVLVNIDVATPSKTPIQTIGNTTFLVYKIKNATPSMLIQSLKNLTEELQNSNVQDKELADSLNSARFVKDTNSLLFTGSNETLARVEPLVERFDVAAPTAPIREQTSTYVVYSPKYQSGQELINILCDFMQNLMNSGISDTGLFDSINHLKYISKTNSLLVSGDQDSITKVMELLSKFDIPSKESAQPSISSIESANFLIYKLQYHQGSEIQTALKQVATSLNKTNAASNKNLIDAVDSLQWIQVTNSLLGTGDPEVLSKLRDLIQNLDIPLRQVFIEVLVIETTLTNSQNFGLQWGTQLQYLNKTIGAMGNFPTSTGTTNGSSTPTSSLAFAPQIAATTAGNTPVQGTASPSTPATSVPFTSGFDLGVIGDIIMHKGKSFISLGSLVNALQIDNDTTVILNPKIITQDGQTSTIFVGQNIPFVGSFVSNTQSTSNTLSTSNIEYRDVGVNLSITPTLGTNNIVTMDINQDISEQTANTSIQVQGSNVSGVQTTHTSMVTRVHVPDRHFLILSGMINDSRNHFRTSIPCLGGLPVIGALFSENDRSASKANVIIFLRPFIIDSFDEYDRLTQAEEELFKQEASLPTLKEDFDDGVEMIKNLDND